LCFTRAKTRFRRQENQIVGFLNNFSLSVLILRPPSNQAAGCAHLKVTGKQKSNQEQCSNHLFNEDRAGVCSITIYFFFWKVQEP
jgi:hypothetical protein